MLFVFPEQFVLKVSAGYTLCAPAVVCNVTLSFDTEL